MECIQTEITQMLRIRHPVLLAGMFGVAHHDLAAAVSNAGGLGTIGGLTMKPAVLQKEIDMLKEKLDDKTAFGVDLAWPQVGGKARKTNYDYTGGNFPELIDIIIREKARLFVCAIGVPPRWAVDKLHAAGIIVMNMIGEPKHVEKALAVGVDLICAQGTEAGGHSGDIATLPLIPQCVDRCKGRIGGAGRPVHVVAAGGIYDGRGLAASLSLGAQAVWVGTRFVASKESVGSKLHKEALVKAESADTVRTLLYSGRPVRTYRSEFVQDWETNRSDEIKELCAKGVVPYSVAQKEFGKKTLPSGKKLTLMTSYPQLFGQACGGIKEVLPAAEIVRSMVSEAVQVLKGNATFVARL
eukprot:TRINITY_DN36_c0_g1_i1.p2 TRINITY_DN36_c0_g1~~TRINITY_DN36_c0_g1_i1.p2  ORF type:complete len:378 (+),score=156.40 TRINITY_DN36_c0_g1_i1:72-1136(+)